ncbi:MAG: serine/threonine protein kinase, partial [Candidatus Acidiferrum sp.]
MPAPKTADELLDLIRKSGLLDSAKFETFASQVAGDGDTLTPKQLTKLMIGRGLLTHFQAEQFLLGKCRGFTLGKYKVLERLGFGGTGTVYLCEHIKMRSKVAVKVLPSTKSTNPAALGRFYREARAAGILDHPNLVRCHDIDKDGNFHFLVMDYVDGASLHEIVGRSGKLEPNRAADYIRQAAIGLQHAHEVGLVHRDIKPANILVDRKGVVRLLDLGLARFFNDNEDLLTLKYDENNVLGTADYVAPEQALNSHDVDIRADIYGLGATLYFLLSGQAPFPEGKAAQKLIWHQVKDPTPLDQLRADLPRELIGVVEKMLKKKPEDRYQTPGEVAAALEVFSRQGVPLPTEAEMPRLCQAAIRSTSPGEADFALLTPSRMQRPENTP